MMDAYTHLDMSASDQLADFQSRMASAGVARALAVETWSGDNFSCLKRLIDHSLPQFRIALCFRPEKRQPSRGLLEHYFVAGLRVRTGDLQHLGDSAALLESTGKWLVTHAEKGIGLLTRDLIAVAQAFPRLRIYVPHLAWPRRDGVDDKDWPHAVREISHIPGVVMGISAIAHFSREIFPHCDVAAFASHLIDNFPADSVVAGSDYPLLEKNQYAQYIGLALQWTRRRGGQGPSRLEATCFSDPDAVQYEK
jgi:Amidohydrolase